VQAASRHGRPLGEKKIKQLAGQGQQDDKKRRREIWESINDLRKKREQALDFSAALFLQAEGREVPGTLREKIEKTITQRVRTMPPETEAAENQAAPAQGTETEAAEQQTELAQASNSKAAEHQAEPAQGTETRPPSTKLRPSRLLHTMLSMMLHPRTSCFRALKKRFMVLGKRRTCLH